MRTININPIQQYTAIPNSFIDCYLPHANPTYAVIYLFFYRHCHSGARAITVADVAKTFDVLESDVVKCLRYWEETGLVLLTDTGDDCAIEFIAPTLNTTNTLNTENTLNTPNTLNTENTPIAELSSSTAMPGEPIAKTQIQISGQKMPEIKHIITPAIEPRPIYTVDELELYKAESVDVARLFSAAEQAFGKLLHYNDLNVLFGIYDWLRLPLEVIEKLLEYCAKTDHLNMRYVEKVAIDWAERGIASVDEAEAYIQTFSGSYREIMKALGRGGRNPTTKEIKYMDKWLAKLAMPLQVILEACDRTIMQTGKGSFAYCDKIIADWHGKGVTGLNDVSRVSEEFAVKQNASPKPAPAQANRRQSRFANFTQREWDFNEIERVERAYLESCLSAPIDNGKELAR